MQPGLVSIKTICGWLSITLWLQGYRGGCCICLHLLKASIQTTDYLSNLLTFLPSFLTCSASSRWPQRDTLAEFYFISFNYYEFTLTSSDGMTNKSTNEVELAFIFSLYVVRSKQMVLPTWMLSACCGVRVGAVRVTSLSCTWTMITWINMEKDTVWRNQLRDYSSNERAAEFVHGWLNKSDLQTPANAVEWQQRSCAVKYIIYCLVSGMRKTAQLSNHLANIKSNLLSVQSIISQDRSIFLPPKKRKSMWEGGMVMSSGSPVPRTIPQQMGGNKYQLLRHQSEGETCHWLKPNSMGFGSARSVRDNPLREPVITDAGQQLEYKVDDCRRCAPRRMAARTWSNAWFIYSWPRTAKELPNNFSWLYKIVLARLWSLRTMRATKNFACYCSFKCLLTSADDVWVLLNETFWKTWEMTITYRVWPLLNFSRRSENNVTIYFSPLEADIQIKYLTHTVFCKTASIYLF